MRESEDADDIRRQMEQIRCDLNRDVETLVENAREMTDWRHYVRQYPWAGIAAAAAVGYLAVPRRLHAMYPDPATLEKLARRHHLVVGAPRPQEKGGLAGAVFGMVSSLVMRGLMAYAGQQAGKIFGQQAAEATSGPEPAPLGPLPRHKPR